MCWLCGDAEESIQYIWECEIAKGETKKEWIREIDEWKKNWQEGELTLELNKMMMDEPKPVICEYLRAFDGMIKKRIESSRKKSQENIME